MSERRLTPPGLKYPDLADYEWLRDVRLTLPGARSEPCAAPGCVDLAVPEWAIAKLYCPVHLLERQPDTLVPDRGYIAPAMPKPTRVRRQPPVAPYFCSGGPESRLGRRTGV